MARTRAEPIVIAGAGIAGLAAAIALARKGRAVRILERAEEFQPIGAGIQLSPNATRLLDRLGVLPRLEGRCVEPQCIAMRDARSLRALATIPLGLAARKRWGAPYLVAARAALQDALLETAAALSIPIETGATATDFAPESDGIAVTIDRGGVDEQSHAPLLIGADGVWSTLRSLGAEGASRFSGQTAWRTLLARDSAARAALAHVAPADRVTALAHPRFHLIVYPLAGGDMNLVAIARGRPMPEVWSRNASAERMSEVLAGASAEIRNLARDCTWTAWPLHITSPNCGWTHPGGFVLIGDAAHAILPFAAQGAAMAIEDAVTLAALLDRHEDLATALAVYDRLRRPRIRRVAARGELNRLAWHARGPVALARDVVFRMKGDDKLAADLDWLYGYDAERIANSE